MAHGKPNAKAHSERKHSKFSASGAERWFNCQGSVALSEGLPDKSSIWSLEGTKAHEVLEELLSIAQAQGITRIGHAKFDARTPRDMVAHAVASANFILSVLKRHADAEFLIETRIALPFIHPEMFGTFDSAVVDHFGTLHVFDFKYGQGVFVSPVESLQMIFYGLGLAHRYAWNFQRVRLWIVQPRVKGFNWESNGPLFWDLSIPELRAYVKLFQQKVREVERFPKRYAEGPWCHWCKAKKICPLKKEAKREIAETLFAQSST